MDIKKNLDFYDDDIIFPALMIYVDNDDIFNSWEIIQNSIHRNKLYNFSYNLPSK